MSHRSLDLRHPLDSCTFLLHSWRPFLDSDQQQPPANSFQAKRPCLSDRTTSFSIDLSKLTIVDDDRAAANGQSQRRSSYRLIARKRRRRGSRSVSGRSSDRSGTRRCCSVGASAAYGTCSDFPVAMGTDSSGELFVNGADSSNWPSDVSEARHSRRDNRGDGGGNGGSGEKDGMIGVGFSGGLVGGFDGQGTESGYGSEPGYRGDAEFGYGDEIDEEDDDSRLLFWADQFGEHEPFSTYLQLLLVKPQKVMEFESIGKRFLGRGARERTSETAAKALLYAHDQLLAESHVKKRCRRCGCFQYDCQVLRMQLVERRRMKRMSYYLALMIQKWERLERASLMIRKLITDVAGRRMSAAEWWSH